MQHAIVGKKMQQQHSAIFLTDRNAKNTLANSSSFTALVFHSMGAIILSIRRSSPTVIDTIVNHLPAGMAAPSFSGISLTAECIRPWTS